MKRLLIALALLVTATLPALSGTPSPIDPASLPKDIRDKIASLRPGITREQAGRFFAPDGGISPPYRNRYILRGFKVGHFFIMVVIEFQPADMPDTVYADKKLSHEWLDTHGWGGKPKDTIREVGRPFLSIPSED